MGAAAPGGGIPWTPKEKQFLMDNPRLGVATISKRLGKSVHAVNHMRRALGLSRSVQKKTWASAEDEYLRQARAEGKTAAAMAQHLGRNKNMVNCRLKKLSLTTPLSKIRLSEEHKKFILDHPNMSGVELSKRLGFRSTTLLRHRRELGLPPLLHRDVWTSDEERLIRNNLDRKLSETYRLLPYRSHSSIALKAAALGRRRHRNKGFSVNRQGYRLVYENGAPVLEHHKVMEESLGRKLRRGETVHHINKDRGDNRLENLVLFRSNSEHMKAEYSYLPLVSTLLERGIIRYDQSMHEYRLSGAIDGHRQSTLPC